MIVITEHAEQRISTRVNIEKPRQFKHVVHVYRKGTHEHNAPDALQEYLFCQIHQYESTSTARVYQNFVYLFAGNILKTVIHLPKKFYKIQNGARGRNNYYNRNSKQFGR